MGKMIQLTAEDGHTFDAYRADPDGKPRGGLVVIQEIFGVNAHIRSVCEGFARQGYAAIAPALFDRAQKGVDLGYQQEDITKGMDFRKMVETDDAMKDIKAAAAIVTDAGKVGTVGYCWGGTLAWLAATRLGLPSVAYYGGQVAAFASEKPQAPVMLHFGEKDHAIPMTDVEKVRAAHPDIPIFVYPAGHGFSCDERGSYHAESAKTALDRTLGFLTDNIG